MQSVKLQKPMVFLPMGYPGAGKTFFSRQLSSAIGAFHLNADRLRYQLYEEPRFTSEENEVVDGLMSYMFEELLNNGVSIIVDANNNSRAKRRHLKSQAAKQKVDTLVIWVQTDIDTAYARATNRDRRNPDDKYSFELDRETFDRFKENLTKPINEDYVVISGKHVFRNQLVAVLNRLGKDSLKKIEKDNSVAPKITRMPSRNIPRRTINR